MIEWFERVDPDAVFLRCGDDVWTYGEAALQIAERAGDSVEILSPGIDPDSLFAVLGAMAGAGAILLGPSGPPTSTTDLAGAALAIFTSGTSGRPKGARLTWENVEAACRASVEHLGHGTEDVWLTALPLHHVSGLSAVARSAYAGGGVRLLSRFDAVGFAREMRSGSTIVSVVPTMLHRILDHDAGPFDNLRAVLVGGGPIPDGLLERASAARMPVLPSYGMTETFGQVATLRPGAALGRRAHPLPGVELRVGDDGPIALRSDQVSPGYLGEVDRGDPWFVTSDLGEVDDEGAVTVLGRADIVIVTGGENVNPERVEAELMGHVSVDEVVVVGVEDELWGSRLVAVYNGSAGRADLESWLTGRLPGFMVPKQWVAVDSIPRTPLGKPDRRQAQHLVTDL